MMGSILVHNNFNRYYYMTKTWKHVFLNQVILLFFQNHIPEYLDNYEKFKVRSLHMDLFILIWIWSNKQS